MKRFLFNFSYIGNKYSGVAKQANSELTIVSVIEKCIRELAPVTLVSKTNLSSRTDAGVHAVSNTMHADLNVNYDYFEPALPCHDKENFICTYLKSNINELIVKKNHLIRIKNVKIVSDDFRSRNASCRTYVYRLALYNHDKPQYFNIDQTKPEKGKVPHKNLYFAYAFYQNVIENDFLIEIREPFDKSKFLAAIELLCGQHNFSAFTTNVGRKDMLESNKNPIKNVKIKIHPERSSPLHEYTNKFENNYSIMELEITAESFLYKMIRKMIGAAVDVGRNKMSLDTISEMLTCPADFYNQDSIVILKPNGLFLRNVEYNNQLVSEE